MADLPEPPAGEDVFQVETALALLPSLSKEDTRFLADFAEATDPAAEDVARARELVASLQPALDALHKGFAQPVVSLDGHCADPASQQRLSMLSSARQAARAQAAAARLACIDGRGDDAMLMASDTLRLSEALVETRSFLCALTGNAVFGMARLTAQRAVTGALVSPGLLRETSARFARASETLRTGMADALATERAVGHMGRRLHGARAVALMVQGSSSRQPRHCSSRRFSRAAAPGISG